MVANGPGDVDDPQAPIRNGDYIEFPGGLPCRSPLGIAR